MISIISTNNNNSIAFLNTQIALRGIEHTYICSSVNNMSTHINSAVVFSNIVILVGDNFAINQQLSRVLDLPLVFDKATHNNIYQYCSKTSQPLPAQHKLDNMCSIPEGFVSLHNNSSLQCACYGQYKKTTVFVLPDNFADVSHTYNEYISKIVDKLYTVDNTIVYKVFGLHKQDIDSKLGNILNKRIVSHYCETNEHLDSLVVIRPLTKLSASAKKTIHNSVVTAIGANLYANSNVTPAEELVNVLLSLHKTVSVAESITGGMIASNIVDVARASQVLLESAVTYTVGAKQRRLSINPHMIDTYGVVSSQVAEAMVNNIKQQTGSDYAIATTGYAGPTAVNGQPVGLCYVGIATNKTQHVYKLQLGGDRTSIRQQVTNSAILLLLNAIKSATI